MPDTTEARKVIRRSAYLRKCSFKLKVFLAPEGGASALYLLLAGSVCFGAMRLGSRNQLESYATA